VRRIQLSAKRYRRPNYDAIHRHRYCGGGDGQRMGGREQRLRGTRRYKSLIVPSATAIWTLLEYHSFVSPSRFTPSIYLFIRPAIYQLNVALFAHSPQPPSFLRSRKLFVYVYVYVSFTFLLYQRFIADIRAAKAYVITLR